MVGHVTLVTEVPFSNRPSYLSLYLPPLLQIPRLLSAQHGAVALSLAFHVHLPPPLAQWKLSLVHHKGSFRRSSGISHRRQLSTPTQGSLTRSSIIRPTKYTFLFLF